ncbi:MAG: tetrapyrrole methylase [Desulfobacter sp.]|nr:MAG: tetrapyrrole methylase [Desulfobacter sp.]
MLKTLVILFGIGAVIIIIFAGIKVIKSKLLFRQKSARGKKGRLYIIGTGPAGPKTATIQALKTIKKMDAVIAPKKHAMLFSKYIGTTPRLFDPWEGFFDYKGKEYYLLDKEELSLYKEECFKIRDQRLAVIKDLLGKGKNVGILDMGNPCLFGPGHWYIEQLPPDDVVIIPGMGVDSAALSALGKSIIPAGDSPFVMQTAPFFLTDIKTNSADQVLKDVSKFNINSIHYMALNFVAPLFKKYREVYPDTTPCAVVFWAGFPLVQRIVKGTLGDMAEKLSKEKEKYMGIIFIGDFLEGKPYESAMKGSIDRLLLS